ncbi:alanine racemase [Patescibacteria group bacterium]|nr:alanine racemase [Patescibacteria group bacterium]
MNRGLLSHDRTTYIEVDLKAIAQNIQAVRKLIGSSVELMPVVKANAYGHGAVEVAKTAVEHGADRLAVNRVAEGLELRRAGISVPIVVLGYAGQGEMGAVVEHDLTPTITELPVAKALSAQALASGKEVDLHVKVDTGMGRLGLLPQEIVPFFKRLVKFPGIHAEGIFTHFSVADSKKVRDRKYTREQFKTFQKVLAEIANAGFDIPLRHVANSAATMYYPETHLDLVRPGIIIYGLPPAADHKPTLSLKPALSLKSRVARIRTLPARSSLGYGRRFTAKKKTAIALVPVGYGDGYHRLLSTRGEVLINGKRAPIVGTISMDQLMVDVSRVGAVKIDQEVVLLGKQGKDRISAEEVASWAETINYEVVSSLLPRVPRVY